MYNLESDAIQWDFDVVSVLQDYIAETAAICLGYGNSYSVPVLKFNMLSQVFFPS